MKLTISLNREKKNKADKSEKVQVPFSKKLLRLDYIVAGVLLALFFVCEAINGIYAIHVTNKLLQMGIDMSSYSVIAPFNLDMFGVLLGIWIAQLGISTGAYYALCKSDHKMELPIILIQNLPEEVKQSVDMTTIISTALTSSDN